MVSLSYTDTRLGRGAKGLRRRSTWLGLVNWRLGLVLVLNVAAWIGVAKLIAGLA